MTSTPLRFSAAAEIVRVRLRKEAYRVVTRNGVGHRVADWGKVQRVLKNKRGAAEDIPLPDLLS